MIAFCISYANTLLSGMDHRAPNRRCEAGAGGGAPREFWRRWERDNKVYRPVLDLRPVITWAPDNRRFSSGRRRQRRNA